MIKIIRLNSIKLNMILNYFYTFCIALAVLECEDFKILEIFFFVAIVFTPRICQFYC